MPDFHLNELDLGLYMLTSPLQPDIISTSGRILYKLAGTELISLGYRLDPSLVIRPAIKCTGFGQASARLISVYEDPFQLPLHLLIIRL